MSIFVSDTSHSINTTTKNSEYKKSVRGNEKFQTAAAILATAAGLASFIYLNVDLKSLTSFFSNNEAASQVVSMFVVPVFSCLAGAALIFYSKKDRK